MDDLYDPDLRDIGQRTPIFNPADLPGWNVRMPTETMRQWSLLNGLAHGVVWAFPFVAAALLWRAASDGGNGFWPALLFTLGMLFFIMFLVKGLLLPRTWWYAYTDAELIVEHGLIFKARDHLAFDRVQYLETRSGPLMRPRKISALVFDTAAGRATVPAALLADVETIETHVRTAMLRPAVL